jgi:GNAT superfamily N-acetyltransferase
VSLNSSSITKTKQTAENNILKKKRITIREYRPSDQARVINLLNSPSIKPDIWRWQFDNHYSHSSINSILAEDRWGNILGFNGMMPVKLHTERYGELDAAWSCDFFVSRETRGLGVGKAIKQELKRQSSTTFALGTSETAAAVLNKSGWKPFNKVYLYIRKQQTKPVANNSIETVLTTKLPEATITNALWERSKGSYKNIVTRDHNYLHWRYAQSPIARYQYIECYQHRQLIGLAVFHQNTDRISLVDYLGPRERENDKQSIILKLHEIAKPLGIQVQCTTSDSVWQSLLLNENFEQSAKPVNCFIYSEQVEQVNSICEDFYIMSGDCDGDILGSSIAQAKEADKSKMEAVQFYTKQLTFRDFVNLKPQWEQLLNRSHESNLFTSWDWMHTWWTTFAHHNNFTLNLIACFSKSDQGYDQLVGIAPLYRRHYKRLILNVTQVQFIGCSWSGPNTFRSEYLDFICDKHFARDARMQLLQHLFSQTNWDELVLGDIPHQSLTTRLIGEAFSHTKLYTRTVHEDHSIQVPCNLSEENYKEKLSANFRRSTIHKYAHLENQETCFMTTYTKKQIVPFDIIDTLNNFHLARWGKLCFEGLNRDFHEQLIEHFSESHRINICVIRLSNDDKKENINSPISLSYNLVHNNKLYNIQLGFDEKKFPKYSIGLIQLTQNILSAIKSKKYEYFDLLAGYGKQEFYKERFGGYKQQISTIQYLRRRWLKLLYRIYDKYRIFFRRTSYKLNTATKKLND